MWWRTAGLYSRGEARLAWGRASAGTVAASDGKRCSPRTFAPLLEDLAGVEMAARGGRDGARRPLERSAPTVAYPGSGKQIGRLWVQLFLDSVRGI